MNTFEKSIIAPETIAAKLAAAANLSEPGFAELIAKEPRLVELLWFLQWESMQPGGLEKFALDVVDQFAPMFGPAILNDDSATLTGEQRLEIWDKIKGCGQWELIPDDLWKCEDSRLKNQTFWQMVEGDDYPYRRSPKEERYLRPLLSKLSREQFKAAFISAAKEHLAAHLRSMCSGPSKWLTAAPWWCDDLAAVLFEAMDAHARRAALQLARTEIVSTVFETLAFAQSQKVLVQIEGDSRFGKTESIRAWCNMHPGRARLVCTPGSNYDTDMYKAVAESLGVQFTHKSSRAELKEKVEFIIRNCGLMFVFDEAHFLLPQRVTRNALPTRLNWVRTQIIDRKLAVAIVTTPQAFGHAVNKFARATGYNFEQLLGRIAHTATLPDSLSQDDLLAIAKFHGPDLSEPLQRLVVAKALQKQSYIKAVENIIALARWNSSRAGHPAITLEDVDMAAAGRIHGQAIPIPAAPLLVECPAQRPLAARRGRIIKPAPPALEMPPGRSTMAPAALEAPARSITPETQLV